MREKLIFTTICIQDSMVDCSTVMIIERMGKKTLKYLARRDNRINFKRGYHPFVPPVYTCTHGKHYFCYMIHLYRPWRFKVRDELEGYE